MRAFEVGKRRGFSLVELLVVIAVIVILLALLLPGIGMLRASARARQCASNQVQIWHAWTRANSRDSQHPVRGAQWTTRVSAYIEGGEGVLFCPDDTTRSQPSSYAFNAHAWRFGGDDDGRIVLLDYKQTEIKVVSQSLAQLDADWPAQQAPRHSQTQNVTFFDGHGTSYEPRKIDPRFCDYYARYWRPVADSNIALLGCVNSGDPPPSVTAPATSTTTTGTTGAASATSTSTTTAGGTTTAGTTTTGTTTGTSTTTTTTSTTTGVSTATTSTTGGTTTGCANPPTSSLNGGLVALYTFDDAADIGKDTSGQGNHVLPDTRKTLPVQNDPQRCKVAWFRSDSEVGIAGGGGVFNMPVASLSGNEWSLAYWYKTDNTNVYWGFTRGPFASNFLLHGIRLEGSWIFYGRCGCSPCTDCGGPSYPTGTWHHFGYSKPSSGNFIIYVDGQLHCQNPASNLCTSYNSWPPVVNGGYQSVGVPWPDYGETGHFDNFRVYNRVLSAAEFNSIYQSEL